ncbi:hypothetical protein V491_04194 [Pseudogymnoascus sp. VKM F-3775]|nr:hypothetical protein V491_04194 [Pseudogymnoascus sp. VKM F-3775]
MRSRTGATVHLLAQRIDVARIALQGVADLILKVIDDDEVREEGDEVLNLEKGAAREEGEGCGDSVALADDGFGDEEPELLA